LRIEKKVLDRTGVMVAVAGVLAAGVINGAVAGDLTAQRGVHAGANGHEVRSAIRVLHDHAAQGLGGQVRNVEGPDFAATLDQ
jgi:hypothetical protein